MYKFLTVIVLMCFSCTTFKISNNQIAKTKSQTDLYYINCTFFPKGSHMKSMAGLGSSFNYDTLKRKSFENFQESFYEQFVYTPPFDPLSYRLLLDCLNFNHKEDIDRQFYERYILSEKIDTYKVTLEDGNYVTIEIYRVLGNMEIIYINNLECIPSDSLEINVRNIKTVNRIAVLVPKE